MKTQIRDLELIEKELTKSHIGILALIIEQDKIVQVPVRYLYHDKNVFLFFSNNDELFAGIPFGAELTFTIASNTKIKAKEEDKSIEAITITISGSVKTLDDHKYVVELRKHYNKKYKIHQDEELNVIMVDTQEFLAFTHFEG